MTEKKVLAAGALVLVSHIGDDISHLAVLFLYLHCRTIEDFAIVDQFDLDLVLLEFLKANPHDTVGVKAALHFFLQIATYKIVAQHRVPFEAFTVIQDMLENDVDANIQELRIVLLERLVRLLPDSAAQIALIVSQGMLGTVMRLLHNHNSNPVVAGSSLSLIDSLVEHFVDQAFDLRVHMHALSAMAANAADARVVGGAAVILLRFFHSKGSETLLWCRSVNARRTFTQAIRNFPGNEGRPIRQRLELLSRLSTTR